MGRCFRVAVLALLVGWSHFAAAGVIRDDVPDQDYLDLAARPEFQAVGKLLYTFAGVPDPGKASGTLIAPNWVLTAAHVLDDQRASSMVFQVDGNEYSAAEWITHHNWSPGLEWENVGWDIGLVRLASPVQGVAPAELYRGSQDIGRTGIFVGFGRTGTGLTGAPSEPETYGTKRAGENMIDTDGRDLDVPPEVPPEHREGFENVMLADFDKPHDASKSTFGHPNPWPLEYCFAAGDSGGGVFVGEGASAKLAGVNSFTTLSVGKDDPLKDADYGEILVATRVSSHIGWIDDRVSNPWTSDSGIGYFDLRSGMHSVAGNLYHARDPGSTGAYHLWNGELVVHGDEFLGHSGAGYFTHSGGNHSVGMLYLGQEAGSTGAYELSGRSSLLGVGGQMVGVSGAGYFTQHGGTNIVTYELHLGSDPGSSGTYELRGGELRVEGCGVRVGVDGTASFIQTGGKLEVVGVMGASLDVGCGAGSHGAYQLSRGEVLAAFEYVGIRGTGRFVQTGGTNQVLEDLFLGLETGSDGRYELSGGELSTGVLGGQVYPMVETIGCRGTGWFIQTAGRNVADFVYVAYEPGSHGSYELAGGEFSVANWESLGHAGAGVFSQSGGTHAAGTVWLGYSSGSEGTYNTSGGSLLVEDLYVGYDGCGTLNIVDAAADISVSGLLHFGPCSTFAAVPGARIKMTGSAFENENIEPSRLAGFSNLALIFEGGSAVIDSFEVAGWDMGESLAGLEENFALAWIFQA